THFIGLQQSLEEYEALEAQFHQAQKMEAIGTLVGGIAHDFNNLLAGITGNTYLLKKEISETPGSLRKLNTIEDLSYRAAGLIRQLLTFARKDRVEIKSMPLSIFLKEFIKLIRASTPENIQIKQDIPADSMTIKGDATQLNQVLMNLMNNAVYATGESPDPLIEVTLERYRKNPMLHPDWKDEMYAHLIVKDNGHGISKEHKKHLFEPFFTTKPQGKGTGLGLAMTFGAIKTHHGHIEVESQIGRGTSFHIYLPLTDEEHEPEQALHRPVLGEGETILLVDDEENLLSASADVLESLNYHILKASNGLDAVKIFKAHHAEISLIIMDVIMPKMGGVEAFEQISAEYPETKVVFLTGYDKGNISKANKRMDKFPIISKPYEIGNLSKLIRKLLDA
ncbi:MAG TPA: ATP-binding protein, partial [Mariprofundaceae bacterium]|nr:ATP-binding protein [Mariprofundaceae bacterium]